MKWVNYISLFIIGILIYRNAFQNHALEDSIRIIDTSSVNNTLYYNDTLRRLKLDLINKPNARSYLFLGDFYLLYGECDKALHFYRQSLQINGGLYDAHIGYAVCIDLLGHKDMALIAYQDAINNAEEDYHIIESKHRQAKLLLQLGKTKEAVTILKLFNNYEPALADLCRAYVAMKDWPLAKQQFDLLVKLDDRNIALEIYQLNALASRHFDKPFTDKEISIERELMYSDHRPFEIRTAIAQHTFGQSPQDLYSDKIQQLPSQTNNALFYSEEQLRTAAQDPSRVNSGANLFKSSNCILCHGINGNGLNGPNLIDDYWIIENANATNIFLTIKNGRANNTMPAYSKLLGPGQIRDITAFLLDLNHKSSKTNEGISNEGKTPEGTFQTLAH